VNTRGVETKEWEYISHSNTLVAQTGSKYNGQSTISLQYSAKLLCNDEL